MGEDGGWGGEMGVFVAMLVAKVVGCQIEANFQKAEWESKSETQLINKGYAYEVLSF